jgi:hypothetical protein
MILSVRRLLLSAMLITLIQGAAAAQNAQNTLIFPQFVIGADYVSTVTLVNTNASATVTGTLFVYNQDGTPRATPVDGRGTSSSFAVNIPPGGTAVLNTTPGGPAVVVGMATFVSDFPAQGVVRYSYSGGQIGVVSAVPEFFATLVINTANGNDTGLAISNPGATPISLRLVQVDASGAVVQTLDPPELNPLPPNGQVSKFITQFGFNQISNLSSGSIQIQTKGLGQFAAVAILVKNAAFASTGLVDGASGKLAPAAFQGSYSGTWNNTTFGTSGGAFLSQGVVTSTSTVLALLTLTGNVFGAPNPAPTLLSGTYSPSGFSASGTSALFGPITMTVTADGVWTMTANSVPSANVSTFKLTGTAKPEGFSGTYTIGLAAGGNATGTLVLNHTGR